MEWPKEQWIDQEVEVERLNLQGYEIHTEMISGKKKFVLEVEPLELHPFERKFLGAQVCKSMLPMNFLKMDNKELIYYDFTGLMGIKNYIASCNHYGKTEDRRLSAGGEDVKLALTLLANMLLAVRSAEDCLLFLERYYFSGEIVFIDPETQEVKLAYLPERNVLTSIEQKIMKGMDSLEQAFHNADVTEVMAQLKKYIINNNLGIEGIIREVGKRKRKLVRAYEA